MRLQCHHWQTGEGLLLGLAQRCRGGPGRWGGPAGGPTGSALAPRCAAGVRPHDWRVLPRWPPPWPALKRGGAASAMIEQATVSGER